MHKYADLDAVDQHGHFMYVTREPTLPSMRTHVWLYDTDGATRIEVIPFAAEPAPIDGLHIVYCWPVPD